MKGVDTKVSINLCQADLILTRSLSYNSLFSVIDTHLNLSIGQDILLDNIPLFVKFIEGFVQLTVIKLTNYE